MSFACSIHGYALPDAFPRVASPPRWIVAACLATVVCLGAVSLSGCKRFPPTDTSSLDKAGMWYGSIEELRKMDVSDAEVAELADVREAGVSDAGCIELVRLTRERRQPFASGGVIVALRQVGVSEATILELARLNQLGLWVGEAQAMRLAGLSDRTLLAVARRRATGQATLSGPFLARLKNAGLSEAEILGWIERGLTDAQAEDALDARQRAANHAGFVRYHRRRR